MKYFEAYNAIVYDLAEVINIWSLASVDKAFIFLLFHFPLHAKMDVVPARNSWHALTTALRATSRSS